MKRFVAGLFCLLPLIYSCHSYHPKEDKANQVEIKERMMNANKIIVDNEAKRIDEYIATHQWKMQMTGTGLRIQIYEEGSGKKPTLKNDVSISYKLFLLDGTLCYSFDDLHPQRLALGGGDIPRGLSEGLMTMKEGSKARMVVPYHLGYGFTGDGNKIPSASTLFYDVHLIKVAD